MLGIADDALAFMVDRAVYYFGSTVEADIEEAVNARKSKTAQKLVQVTKMNSWLGVSQYRSV